MGIPADDLYSAPCLVHEHHTISLVRVEFHGVTFANESVSALAEVDGVLGDEDFLDPKRAQHVPPPN